VKALAVLTLRNEASFLLEWLAHHRAVGFTDFLVLSNDCDDGTDRMLDRLEALGLLTHPRNDGPYDKGGIQFTGLKLARARREDRQYLRNLLRHLDDKGRTKLAHALCKNVTTRMDGVPAFERRLKGLETRLAELEGADS